MVSPSLFELLPGELVDIVDYAGDHYKKIRRPLRLAVNASSWWYANMTAATAQALQAIDGVHVNPIERNILFYTLRILHLGIQLHFVFDGPKRLNNGGKLYPGHDAPSLLFQDTLTNVGLPWHEAPAEAEAECARMEIEGVVDGVWSEDGDALAFGCRTLVKFFFEIKSSTEKKEDVRKSFTHFKVYKLDDLATQYPGMDREGFTLYAILNGRPSNVGELYNLGPQDVLDAAAHGLGMSLCATSRSGKDLRPWTTEFAAYLKAAGSNLEIPPEFPVWEHIQDYLNPIASTPETPLDLQQPCSPDEKILFSFLVDNFQWSIKQWVKYVVPFRIVQSLLATEQGTESQHNPLKLECDLKKSPTKTKATFLLRKATSLDVSALYEEKGVLETLPWILRKANVNQQRSIASYFLTPNSDQKGKDKSSVSLSGKPFQQLEYGANKELLTPPSGSSSSNGEGSSMRRERSRRQSTPPSPTPASRKRKLPWATGVRTSKNMQPAPKNDHGTSAQTNDSGKGKRKKILANAKRARSPANPNSSSNAELGDKRPKLAASQLPSTPPSQSVPPTNAVKDIIMITSDSDSKLCNKGPKPPSTPPSQTPKTNNFIMIESDSDSEGYGSFPSVTDLPILSEDTAAKVIRADDGMGRESSSGDEYGSFPTSPDLRALG